MTTTNTFTDVPDVPPPPGATQVDSLISCTSR
jgi:hypothetical protein